MCNQATFLSDRLFQIHPHPIEELYTKFLNIFELLQAQKDPLIVAIKNYFYQQEIGYLEKQSTRIPQKTAYFNALAEAALYMTFIQHATEHNIPILGLETTCNYMIGLVMIYAGMGYNRDRGTFYPLQELHKMTGFNTQNVPVIMMRQYNPKGEYQTRAVRQPFNPAEIVT